MRFRGVLGSVLFAFALALALVPAAMAIGSDPPRHAVDKCWAAIVNQQQQSALAGGGPKVGIAPANCDHFFQAEGLIGNNLPGFPSHP